VNVGHRADITARGVNSSVNPELGVRLTITLSPITVEVEHQQARRIRQRRAGPRGKYEGIRRSGHSRADVAEGAYQARCVHNPIRQGHVAPQLFQLHAPQSVSGGTLRT